VTQRRSVSVDVDVSDGILTLLLDRPEAGNALTPADVRELCAGLDAADERDDVRAVVLTGTGRRFSVGADLSGGGGTFGGRGGGGSSRDWGGVLALRLFACTKPVVAAVNGDAVGLGATMLLPTDVRLAVDTARFGFVFTRRGIVPEACSSWFLPRVVGISTALQWTLSGRLVGADEALRAGLVHEVCTPEGLLDRARETARGLTADGAPVSVAATRQMMWRGLTMAHPMEAHRMETAIVRARGAGADAREGVTAFLERRAAQFPGLPSEDLVQFRHWWADPPFEAGDA
jgi:enoyl-CoA hydratase/carnithine racemase